MLNPLVRLSGIAVALWLTGSSARADSFSALCDAASSTVVLVPTEKTGSKPEQTSDFLKNLTEGGGLATAGYKSFTFSNTVTRDDIMKFLAGLGIPAAESGVRGAEIAETMIETLIRSKAFKAGSVGVAAVGGYFVFKGIVGNAEPSPDEMKQKLDTDIRSVGLDPTHLAPCPYHAPLNRPPTVPFQSLDAAATGRTMALSPLSASLNHPQQAWPLQVDQSDPPAPIAKIDPAILARIQELARQQSRSTLSVSTELGSRPLLGLESVVVSPLPSVENASAEAGGESPPPPAAVGDAPALPQHTGD